MSFDYAAASGIGTDTIDKGVLGPPFLNIVQKGSPEFDETHRSYADKHIDGCRPGNILFEPERRILTQPLSVVPLAQTTAYTMWKPNKGGSAGNMPLTVTSLKDYRKGTPGTPTEYKEYLGQNELVYTITFLILFKDGSEWKKGLIAFNGTQLKWARNWSKTILGVKIPNLPEGVRPPIFAAKYDLTTFADSNGKGGWFAWKITPAGLINPTSEQALLEQALEGSKGAAMALPGPQAQPALAAAAVVDDSDGAPY